MAKIKKSVQKQNLIANRVWIVDDEPNSRYFRLSDIPDVLTAGKNAILINGSPELEPTTEVKIEILDSTGNPVFIAPVRNYAEGLARVLSIEVYDDTPVGPATLTILGHLRTDEFGNTPPDEFVTAYNVKWTKQIVIAPDKANTTPVRLYDTPTLTVSEILAPFRTSTVAAPITVTTGSVTLASNLAIPGDETSRITSLNSVGSSLLLSSSMEGGQFMAVINGTPFTSSVVSVINSTSALLSGSFASGSDVPVTVSSYQIVYTPPASFTLTPETRSFANVHLDKLTTFSGEINRVKVYGRSLDQKGDYQIIGDFRASSPELTNTSSLSTGEPIIRIGDISSQTVISNYWNAGTISGNTYTIDGALQHKYSSTVISDAMHLNEGPLTIAASSLPRYFMGTSAPLLFEQQHEYGIDVHVAVSNPGNFDARMDIYLFGNAFPSSSSSPFGVQVASYVLPASQSFRDYGILSSNIIAPTDGTAYLRFVMYAGDWNVGDIVVSHADERGFNASQINALLPMFNRRLETMQFKAELYDANSNLVPILIESSNVFFDGGNYAFRGTDNRIVGDLKVGLAGNGIVMTAGGYTGSGGPVANAPAIYIGGGTFGSADTPFLVASSSTGTLFSLGNALKWDGTSLIISGGIALSTGGLDTRVTALEASASTGAASGSATAVTASRALTSASTLDTRIFTDSSGFITRPPTGSQAGLYLGTNFLGFFSASLWRTYMNNIGHFFLTGSNGSSNYLAWDGNSLTIAGNITITAGATLTSITNASASAAGATTTANSATTTATNASSSAATALNNATAASASAVTAQTTATQAQVTASNAAVTASNANTTATNASSSAATALTTGTAASASAAAASASAAAANTAATQAALTASIANASASAAQTAANFLDTKIFTDANGMLVKTPNTGNAGLFLGVNNLGYYSGSSWKTYMDNLGKFFLTGSSTNFLAWDGSTLTIAGNINIVAGPSLTAITNAQSTANTATSSAALAQATASQASSSIILTQATASAASSSATQAQATASTAFTSASNAQGTANTAVTNAAIAQTTANNATASAASAQTTANAATASAAAAAASASAASASAALANTSSSLIDAKVFTDSSGKLVKIPNTGSAGLYIGSTFLGYYSASVWRTYMSDTGKFFLTGSAGSSNYLTWDGNTLSVAGAIEILSGNTLGAINSAQSTANTATASATIANASASLASASAATAQSTANTATSNAANAQSTANTATASAATAQSTANTATASAANAQTTANAATASAATANTSASLASASAALAFNSASAAAALALAATQSAQFLDTKIFTDINGKLVKTPNSTSAGLYIGSTNLGYYSGSSWKTYMDNVGKFFLTGSTNNFLSWDGSTLTVAGNINIISGPSLTAIQTAQSTANTATSSAAAAQTTATQASASVTSTQATASAASASAATAQGTANTAVTNAAIAQTTANSATASAAQAQATASAASASAIQAQASASLAQASASAAATLALAATQSAQFLDTKIFTDINGKLVKTPTTSSAGLFLGQTFMGYYNGAIWQTYMDNAGKFFLTGSTGSTNFLAWDGTNLTIAGNINLLSGPSLTAIQTAQSTANTATSSATIANTSASQASASAAKAQVTASLGVTNAALAQATASQASASIVTTNATVATVNSKIFTDAAGKITGTPSTSSAGLYLGQTFMGYYNGSAWKTYMSNAGNFFLSGTGTNGLTWDGTALNITGNINITGIATAWGVGGSGDNLFTTVKDWIVTAPGGTPPVNFNHMGPAAYDSIVVGTTPYGTAGKIWVAAPSADNSADGGWFTNATPIDPTKTYRYCVWVKRTAVDSGNIYHGADQNGSISDIGGSTDLNPYFIFAQPTQLNLGEWYLAVGYVFPYNYSGAQQGNSGMYSKLTGVKTLTGTDYRWTNSSVTSAQWRNYLYYVTVAGAQASFFAPMLHIVDGAEPSVDSLLAVGATGVANAATIAGNLATTNTNLATTNTNLATTNTNITNISSSTATTINGVDAKVFTDATGKVVRSPSGGSSGLFIGANNMGYYDGSAWQTYMANNGNFFLNGSGGNSLSWTGGVLTINGTINITGGNAATTTYANSQASTAQANAISTAASDATTKANTAQSTAISTAASDATTKANTAQSNAVSTAAADATTKANAVDAKVFSDATGKLIKTPSVSGAGLYLGNTAMGYYDGSNFTTYMGNNGNFFLSGPGNNSLIWSGGTLTINGMIQAKSGGYVQVLNTSNASVAALGPYPEAQNIGAVYYDKSIGPRAKVTFTSFDAIAMTSPVNSVVGGCAQPAFNEYLYPADDLHAACFIDVGGTGGPGPGGAQRDIVMVAPEGVWITDGILAPKNILMQQDAFIYHNSPGTDYRTAALMLRERTAAGGSSFEAPRLALHWGGVVASQIGIEAGGRIAILNNPGTGYEHLIANNIFGAGFFTTSTKTAKKNIESFKASALDILNKVNVVSFNYISDTEDMPKVGFIAEDTDSLLATPKHDSLDTANTLGLLIKAVQELTALIKDLDK